MEHDYEAWGNAQLWSRLDSATELADELRQARDAGDLRPDLEGRLTRLNDRISRIVSILWDRDQLGPHVAPRGGAFLIRRGEEG